LQFFRNCYFWTIAGGYLFVHLVDPLRFSPVVASDRNQRITRSEIDFLDFVYKSTFTADASAGASAGADASPSCGCATRRESFIDAKTQHVRENEIMLYMYSVDSVVSLALRSGFIVKAKWNLLDSPYSDAHQFIYMFERTL
jgi:hypothetical protein